MMPIVGVSASADGELFASVAEDESAKVFDVVNFGASDGEPLLVSSVCSNSPPPLPCKRARVRTAQI
jgi:hypothetical protein